MALPEWHTILLPLDGSPLGARPIELAERLAQATGARLVLLRAAPGVNPAVVHDATVLALAGAAQQQARQASWGALTEEAERLRHAGLRVHVVVSDDLPAAAIRAAAHAQRADLIILGTHAHAGLGRWLAGSVADEVARTSTTPLVLVPAGVTALWSNNRAPRVLATVDGSALAECILPAALALAGALGGELHLLHVQPHGDADPAGHSGWAVLRRAAGRCAAAGMPAGTHLVRGAAVPAEVLQFAAEHRMDLLAIATHGRGGLARLALGSVASALLAAATVPVLLVRPAETLAGPAAGRRAGAGNAEPR